MNTQTMQQKLPGLQKIINILQNLDDTQESHLGFDMTHSYKTKNHTTHPCGTACCIGGHAHHALLKTPQADKIKISHTITITDALQELCNIDSFTACRLCYPNFQTPGEITLKTALKVLKTARDTGTVNWDI